MSQGNHSQEANSPEKIDSERFSLWIALKKHHEGLQVIFTFVGVLAAIFAVYWQNNVSSQLAAQQNFFSFYQEWESEAMQERRARLAAYLLKEPTPSQNASLSQIDDSALVFLETLSQATNANLTNYDSTWNSFYYDLTNYWAAVEPYVTKLRKDENCECFFSELQTTSIRFNATAKEKGGMKVSSPEEAKKAVNTFLWWEVKRKAVSDSSQLASPAENNSKQIKASDASKTAK